MHLVVRRPSWADRGCSPGIRRVHEQYQGGPREGGLLPKKEEKGASLLLGLQQQSAQLAGRKAAFFVQREMRKPGNCPEVTRIS